MRNFPNDEKAIVIDTEDYAGNFEREMVAYITGLVGECGVGDEAAEIAKKELDEGPLQWFEDHVVHVPDEHGCHRPASISPTPGWSNNGHGKETKLKPGAKMKYPAYLSVEFVVYEWPPDDIMKVVIARAKEFCKSYYQNRDELSRFSGTVDKVIPLTAIRWVERKVTTKDIKVLHDL